jgi:hypothetical protein
MEIIAHGLHRVPAAPRSPILALLGNCIVRGTPAAELERLRRNWEHVLVVPGPSEHTYTVGAPVWNNLIDVRHLCMKHGLHLLHNTALQIGGTTYIGSTMWPEGHWGDEDCVMVNDMLEAAQGQGRSAVVLTHFPPMDLDAFPRLPRAWFYGDRQTPVSGMICGGKMFLAGGCEHETTYRYD